MLFLPSQNNVSLSFILGCYWWTASQKGECGVCSRWSLASFIPGDIWTSVLQDLDCGLRSPGPQLYTCCCQDVPVGQRAQAWSQESRSKCRLMQYVIIHVLAWFCSVLRFACRASWSASKPGRLCLCEKHSKIFSSISLSVLKLGSRK